MLTKVLLCVSMAFFCWIPVAGALPPSMFGPTSYGAKADGKTNDGAAIQKAIDLCTQAGDGTINGNVTCTLFLTITEP